MMSLTTFFSAYFTRPSDQCPVSYSRRHCSSCFILKNVAAAIFKCGGSCFGLVFRRGTVFFATLLLLIQDRYEVLNIRLPYAFCLFGVGAPHLLSAFTFGVLPGFFTYPTSHLWLCIVGFVILMKSLLTNARGSVLTQCGLAAVATPRREPVLGVFVLVEHACGKNLIASRTQFGCEHYPLYVFMKDASTIASNGGVPFRSEA